MGQLNDERWAAHRREHDLEYRAVQEAAELQREAVIEARNTVNARLEGMNELRAQILSERGDFLTRLEYEAKHDALITRIATLERDGAMLRGRDHGISNSWAVAVAGIGILGAFAGAVGLLLRFI